MFLILEIFLVFICGFNSFVYAVENHNLNNVISHNCTADATIVIRGGKMAKSIPGILPVENAKLGVFSMDTESMKVNGKPILPMFGEIHPSRVPESSWRTDLLKMKSGGLMGVSVYLLWIHVEELQGKQVWSGNRNITKFLEIAKEVGIIVFLRIGYFTCLLIKISFLVRGFMVSVVMEACQIGSKEFVANLLIRVKLPILYLWLW